VSSIYFACHLIYCDSRCTDPVILTVTACVQELCRNTVLQSHRLCYCSRTGSSSCMR